MRRVPNLGRLASHLASHLVLCLTSHPVLLSPYTALTPSRLQVLQMMVTVRLALTDGAAAMATRS